MYKIIIRLTFGLICLAAAGILAVTAIPTAAEKPAKPLFRLQAIDGVVTLFEGEQSVESYPEIVLENLPIQDRQQLLDGIVMKSRDAVRQLIEDFDG